MTLKDSKIQGFKDSKDSKIRHVIFELLNKKIFDFLLNC